mmetsp:Transcript_85350/g.238222  ORF Transcript_85350/g.238222 Transcript_85350/m.238222 type:complete len:438 (-) Transcript_85350:3699-5012(-)
MALPFLAETARQAGDVKVVQKNHELDVFGLEHALEALLEVVGRVHTIEHESADGSGFRLLEERDACALAAYHGGDLGRECGYLHGLEQGLQWGRRGVTANHTSSRLCQRLRVLQGRQHLRERHRGAEFLQRHPRALSTLDLDLLLEFAAGPELANDNRLFLQAFQNPDHVLHVFAGNDERHTDTAIERADHFAERDLELPSDPPEDRRQLPALGLEQRHQFHGHNPGETPAQATACDGGGAFQFPGAREFDQRTRIDARGRQQHFAKRLRRVEGRGPTVFHAGGLGQRPEQAEPVAVKAGRRQADHNVARAHPVPVRKRVRLLDDAHSETRKVEPTCDEDPWHLRRPRVQQRAPSLDAAFSDALIHLQGVLRVKFGRGKVAHEEQRLRSTCGNVVDAQRHEIDADGVEALHHHRNFQLRADAAGATGERRALVVKVR